MIYLSLMFLKGKVSLWKQNIPSAMILVFSVLSCKIAVKTSINIWQFLRKVSSSKFMEGIHIRVATKNNILAFWWVQKTWVTPCCVKIIKQYNISWPCSILRTLVNWLKTLIKYGLIFTAVWYNNFGNSFKSCS